MMFRDEENHVHTRNPLLAGKETTTKETQCSNPTC
jgi:hypothetical protein